MGVLRTLLIDNYDSYTYNLFQLLAQVNGVEPEVVHNDEVLSDRMNLDCYDNIVISPGPGHPGRVRDFGFAAHVLTTAAVPVLGVCLGHQGLVLSEGGQVVPAPEPRHGHRSRIRHSEDMLFAGIPTEFAAVRYHSLCVARPLPAELTEIAWAEDGVVMAVRHQRLPRWGVQFHPESIETEYGLRLVRNFRDLTAARSRSISAPRTRKPVHRKVISLSKAQRYTAEVVELDMAVNTAIAFERLYSDSPQAFWLDSSRVEAGLSRFSFLGDNSGPLSETVYYRVDSGVVTVESQESARHRESVFDYLQRELKRRVIEAPALPFDFTGGYIGYFGYELKADCGFSSGSAHRAMSPDAVWLFADRFLAIDHAENRTYLVALTIDDASRRSARRWFTELSATLRMLPSVATPEPAAPERSLSSESWLTRDRFDYLQDIAVCQEKLRAGESYEITLTTMAQIPAAESGLATYLRLRKLNPAPYAAYLRMGGVEVACSSPERFLRIGIDRTVEAKPIKGTAARGIDSAHDEQLRRDLAADRKTRAENLMIVDLIRNDLNRVCAVGSVHVPVLMDVESYQTVHQLVSTVRGTLCPDRDVIDCVRACFPGGSMTGAPKLRTCEIISALEGQARGVYSGAIGFLGCNGTADLNIVIRTLVLVDGVWQIGAGGAIVLDSDPAAEYEEMLLKAAATTQALTGAPELAEAVH